MYMRSSWRHVQWGAPTVQGAPILGSQRAVSAGRLAPLATAFLLPMAFVALAIIASAVVVIFDCSDVFSAAPSLLVLLLVALATVANRLLVASRASSLGVVVWLGGRRKTRGALRAFQPLYHGRSASG